MYIQNVTQHTISHA